MDAPSNGRQRLSFGLFEADLSSGELRKRGQRVHLQVQPFQLLSMLLERPGEVVTREEVRKKLWPNGTFVDFDEGLDTALKKLRYALGDSAQNPRFIETIPRRGYRFMLPVTTNNGQAIATPDSDGRAKQTYQWRFIAITAVVLVIAAVAAGGYFYFHRIPKLTDKDSIVLADFANTTADPVFDGTLRQGLAVQLEQSPFLSLVSDERIGQTLRLMGRPADAKVTPEIGREICQRTESAAVLSGSIVSLGSQYVLGLKAVNCRSGDSLAEEQETADGKEQVLRALSQAATKLRRRLGESLKSVEKFDTPLEQATTTSLEALQAYSQGHRVFAGGDRVAPIPALERAVQLDPNFATAYVELGVNYMTLEKFG